MTHYRIVAKADDGRRWPEGMPLRDRLWVRREAWRVRFLLWRERHPRLNDWWHDHR